jgi:hypothetical protein
MPITTSAESLKTFFGFMPSLCYLVGLVGPKGLSWRSRHFEPSTSAVFLRLRVSPALRKIVIPHGQQTRCMPKASGALNGVVLSSSLARHRRHSLVDYGPTGRRRSGPTALDSHAATVFNVLPSFRVVFSCESFDSVLGVFLV